MDSQNRFETKRTHLIHRAEHLALLLISVGLALAHIDEIRWIPFAALFLYIDVIGYLPGAIAHRRNRGRVAPVYYHLYNLTHNLLTNLVVAGLWCFFVGPEWALLALPIHLLGDRSLFGNGMKPLGVPFEPELHPAFKRFEEAYAQATPGSHAERPREPLMGVDVGAEKV